MCAIALANLLPGLGAVAIIDRSTRRINHASVIPDPDHGWPTVFPWRDQILSVGHPLLTVTPGGTTTRRLRWVTPWNTEAEFYVDATGDVKRVYAIFSADDAWGVDRFHPPQNREFDRRPLLTGYCCGKSFERRGYPCPSCGQPYCPSCQKCQCEREAERLVLCQSCFLKYEPRLVIDGRCIECRS